MWLPEGHEAGSIRRFWRLEDALAVLYPAPESAEEPACGALPPQRRLSGVGLDGRERRDGAEGAAALHGPATMIGS